jgi:hypothetical protein
MMDGPGIIMDTLCGLRTMEDPREVQSRASAMVVWLELCLDRNDAASLLLNI